MLIRGTVQTAIGKKPRREREVGRLLDKMQRGDVLVVAEISRLGRSTLQVLELMAYAGERGLSIHVVKGSMVLDGSAQSKMFATMHALFAEIERDFIVARTRAMLRERTRNGLLAARQEGRIGGRRPKLTARQQQEVVRLVGSGEQTAADAARLFNVHPSTIARLLAKARLGSQA